MRAGDDDAAPSSSFVVDGDEWRDVNANGRIPAGFLIDFLAIITKACVAANVRDTRLRGLA